jgi:hypothetical protein
MRYTKLLTMISWTKQMTDTRPRQLCQLRTGEVRMKGHITVLDPRVLMNSIFLPPFSSLVVDQAFPLWSSQDLVLSIELINVIIASVVLIQRIRKIPCDIWKCSIWFLGVTLTVLYATMCYFCSSKDSVSPLLQPPATTLAPTNLIID